MEDPEEPLRLARGSESMEPPRPDFGDDRPTSAINPLQLRGLIEQAGGLDAEIEVIAKEPPPPIPRTPEEPPAVIVDLPTSEQVQEVRPTCAIDPEALRALVRPPVYPVYRGTSGRWLYVASLAFALVAVLLLVV